MWQTKFFRMTAAVAVCVCMTMTALASDAGPVVRIGLREGQRTASISSSVDAAVYKSNILWKKVKANTPLAITAVRGAIMVDGSSAGGPVTLKPVHSGGNAIVFVGSRAYHGDVQCIASGAGVTIVNEVPLEQYLYGVVGKEMGSYWAPEALKAQSVAARTYAVAHKGYFASRGFDMTDDTYSQSYGGVIAESPSVRQAVDATRGEILTYGGKPIDAMFSASGGGYTEHSENVWGDTVPYLRGVSDPSNQMPDYRWQVTTTAADMERKLAAAGKGVGTIRSITLTPLKKRPITAADRGISGRVKTMTIVGTQGQVRITGNTFQQIFGLKSTLFDFYQGSGVPADIDVNKKRLRGSSFAVRSQRPVVIYGYGFGHGLGMSQWGADQMAKENIGYRAILSHYYSNTTLKKLY